VDAGLVVVMNLGGFVGEAVSVSAVVLSCSHSYRGGAAYEGVIVGAVCALAGAHCGNHVVQAASLVEGNEGDAIGIAGNAANGDGCSVAGVLVVVRATFNAATNGGEFL
jgi:hypothetical protein